jgi:uracil-DNA glycosylase family 4
MTGEVDPLTELRSLTEALRAHAEWQQACGAQALPTDRHAVSVQTAPAALAVPPLVDAAPVPVPPRSAPPRAPEPRAPAAEPTSPGRPAALQLEPAERLHRLSLLDEQVKGCTRCALHQTRTQTVFARGNGSSGLCFIGEGPGADEDAQGFPFVGAAGQLLDRMIAAMGIGRDDVYVCNIVKCRPPQNRTPEPEEMSSCMPYLTEQLSLVEPKVIVALGKTAVQGLFGTVESITRIRGRWRLYQGRIAVMPTFHPAYLLRNPAGKREVWEDLQLVLKHLGRSVPGKGA